MGKYVTMTEIAKRLGVSHSTVSRALSGHPAISKPMATRVRELANELGYQSNLTANQLSHGQSKIIGVIVPDLSVHFYTKVIEGIQTILEVEGYSIMLFNTLESYEKEVQAIELCLKHRVDGVLAAITMKTRAFDHFSKLLKHEVPLIFFDRVANFLPVPKVITNDHDGAYQATQYLINLGCTRIAHITGSINLNNSNNRLYGYLDALKAGNIEIDEGLIHYYEFKVESIASFLSKTLLKYPDLDGLFVFNDYVANYSVNVLQKLGKDVPGDIALVGFSDEPVATYMTPPLTTVQQNAEKMGRLTAQKLISIVNNLEPIDGEKITITPKLIIRGTT